ncbi:hypothetical protein [Pseudomonas sp. S2_C03]
MFRIVLLVIYLAGGWAIYPLAEHLRGLGADLNAIYALVGLDSGPELAARQLLSFAYASIFHFLLAIFISEPAKIWAQGVNNRDVVYLFVRPFGYFLFCFLILGLVGHNIEHRPYSGFQMYFSLLIACVVLGCWSWSVKDFLIGAYYCKFRRRV